MTQLIITPSNATANESNVTDPREFDCNNNEEWVSFINPLFLYLLYYIAIFEAKQLFNPDVSFYFYFILRTNPFLQITFFYVMLLY